MIDDGGEHRSVRKTFTLCANDATMASSPENDAIPVHEQHPAVTLSPLLAIKTAWQYKRFIPTVISTSLSFYLNGREFPVPPSVSPSMLLTPNSGDSDRRSMAIGDCSIHSVVPRG
jgi:hypothetical protein